MMYPNLQFPNAQLMQPSPDQMEEFEAIRRQEKENYARMSMRNEIGQHIDTLMLLDKTEAIGDLVRTLRKMAVDAISRASEPGTMGNDGHRSLGMIVPR